MNKVLVGDVLEQLRTLPDGIVQCVVTSPPYWGLRDYGVQGQLGLEKTPEEYVVKMVDVFREVRRVLRDDGTLWLNLGDSYAGYWGDKTAAKEGRPSSANINGWTNGFSMEKKPNFHAAFDGSGIKNKDLIGIPWRVAFALQADGWYLRQDIIWAKPNPMPESVTDRCTKSHEHLFLLAKSPRYYFDNEAIKEKAVTPVNDSRNKRTKMNGEDVTESKKRGFNTQAGNPSPGFRNRRDVWTISTKPYKGAHFAVFPEALVEPCILAGSRRGSVVLDPFVGSGTTLAVAKRLCRQYIGIELNEKYLSLIEERLKKVPLVLPLLT